MTGAAWRDRHRAGCSRRRIDAAGFHILCVILTTSSMGCSLWTRDNPRYCDTQENCADHNPDAGLTCNVSMHRCEPGGGGTSGGGSGTGGRAGSGGATGTGGNVGTGTGGASGVDGGTDVAVDASGDGVGADVPMTCNPSCGDTKPICDKGTCKACASDNECRAATPMTPLCGTATPTVGKCVACKTDAECTATPATPACFDGVCVPCSASKPCAGPMNPICNMLNHMCEPCATDAQCSSKTATPWCGGGLCVACKASDHCATAAKPICVNNACAACTMDQQCKDKDGTRPACVIATGPTGGTCVECTKHADCPMPTKPICVGNTCVPCSSDSQCAEKSQDPGVCMLHTDKHCATSAEVLYVKPATGCDDTATGMGLANAPFCTPQRAISALTTAKSTIVIRAGTVPVVNWSYAGAANLTVIGQGAATIGPGAGIGVSISSGDVTIRGLTIKGMTDAGISVSGGATVRLNRVIVTGNAGGLVVNASGYDINNSVFSDNNPATAPVPFGGVYLKSASGKPSVFRSNTVTGNLDSGLVCDGVYPIVGVLIANNTTGQVTTCTFSGTDSVVGGTMTVKLEWDTKPYHQTPASPCVNKGGTTDFPPDDLDGSPRPFGTSLVDCGAHELQQ